MFRVNENDEFSFSLSNCSAQNKLFNSLYVQCNLENRKKSTKPLLMLGSGWGKEVVQCKQSVQYCIARHKNRDDVETLVAKL